MAANGSDVQDIYVPSQGKIRIKVLVYGVGLDYTSKYSGTGSTFLEIGADSSLILPLETSTSIPAWIKINVGWWVDGILDDDTFISGIQFLIENNIIQVPDTDVTLSHSNTTDIPDWIKTNAGWWADGMTDDNDDDVFVQTVQFLIRQGIIVG